jgi:MHS family proline/betaine transporter-like MFS transporter
MTKNERIIIAKPVDGSKAVRVIFAALVGNTLEWFDFIIYGYFAATISTLFFPSKDRATSTLIAMATFSVAFIIRPVGGLILGLYADRFGRKPALMLTIWCMVAGSAMIGIAPTAATAGALGGGMIIFARLLQGFAASGEFGSAIALISEVAPPRRHHFAISWQATSTTASIVMGGAIGFSLLHWMSPAEFIRWGWRIPFLFGLILGPIGYYIRSTVEDAIDFPKADHLRIGKGLKELLRDHGSALACAVGINTAGSVVYNLMLIYMPSYAVGQLDLPLSAPFLTTASAGIALAISALVGGWLADRRPPGYAVIITCLVVLSLAPVPLFFWLLRAPSLQALMAVEVLLAIPLGAMNGIAPAIMAAAFPTSLRATGLGVAYNISSPLLGGTSLLIVTVLINATGDRMMPAYYLIIASLFSLVSLLILRRLMSIQKISFPIVQMNKANDVSVHGFL